MHSTRIGYLCSPYRLVALLVLLRHLAKRLVLLGSQLAPALAH